MTAGIPAPTHADLALLTGEPAGELMAGVLSAVGAKPLRWAPRQVDHQPGRRTTVSYAVRVGWSDGSVTEETVGASSGQLPAGVARLTDGHTEIGMWRFPFDPDLPALPAACDADRMRRLAAEVGLGGDGGAVGLRVRAYRPRRRAVVEITAPGGTAFAKVVRPAHARGLHERHRIAAAAGCPVPAALGWTGDGLVMLAGLPGRTLRDLLTGTGSVRLDVEGIVQLLDTLPAELGAGTRRRTWGQQASRYAEVIAAVTPELVDRARAVAAAVDHGARAEGPEVATHGDFYESQLMTVGGEVSGLLDIDTAGRGERLDDAGCLLAHLSVLAQLHPGRAGEINQLGLRVQRRFTRDLEPAALARRTAAVVLSLATGPHRVQERDWRITTARRIALAERWLEHAMEPITDRST
ncbi:MAG: phosphotransferase [Pseudonocardiaceae bacterium]